MKNKIILTIMMGMMLLGIASAANCGNNNIGTFKLGEVINLRQTCDTCSYVNVSSVTIPNSTMLYFNEAMTKQGIEYTYNFYNSSSAGDYFYVVSGDKDGTEQSETFCFSVTPTGIPSSDSRTAVVGRAVWFLFGISAILFIIFAFIKSKPPVKWTFFLISMMFFLQAINILFVGLQDEVVNPKIESYFSFLATSSFILFWFAFGILAILWIVTTFQTILFNKKQRQKEQFGG